MLSPIETDLRHGSICIGLLAASVGGEDLHELRTTSAKCHLLELVAVVEHLAVVVKLESANQRTAVLELVNARTDIHLSLEDVSVGAAIVTRKERYVGQIILSAEIENQSLGQLVRPAVVRMPSARIIVVERVLNRMLASCTVANATFTASLFSLVLMRAYLINRTHLQSGNRLLQPCSRHKESSSWTGYRSREPELPSRPDPAERSSRA